jgi:hypothetical protein
MGAKCYRCGGPTQTVDMVKGWGAMGGAIRKVTETVTTTHIRVQLTRVRYRETVTPYCTDETMPLCQTCWGDVMTFIGVGKRPADRMPS